MKKLNQNFRKFVSLLNSHEVKYLLVGGYAVSIHGYPRYTGDIDFGVEVSEENAVKIVSVLKKIGFDVPGLREELFLDTSRMSRFGRESVKIEILNSVSDLDFSEAFQNKIIVVFDGVELPVISIDDLRRNKQASGRAKDLTDLENLPRP